MPKLTLPSRTAPTPTLPTPTVTGSATLPSARTLTLRQNKATLATLTYHLTPHPFAVLLLLHIEVHPNRRREKIATRLFELALHDAAGLLGVHRLRRVHVGVAHKSHIPLRALLTHLGFHHTGTTTGLLKDEDLLTYIKAYT